MCGACVRAYTHACVCARVCVCVYIMRTYVHVYVHMYVHVKQNSASCDVCTYVCRVWDWAGVICT